MTHNFWLLTYRTRCASAFFSRFWVIVNVHCLKWIYFKPKSCVFFFPRTNNLTPLVAAATVVRQRHPGQHPVPDTRHQAGHPLPSVGDPKPLFLTRGLVFYICIPRKRFRTRPSSKMYSLFQMFVIPVAINSKARLIMHINISWFCFRDTNHHNCQFFPKTNAVKSFQYVKFYFTPPILRNLDEKSTQKK